jgi:IS4 transposase
MTKKEKFQRELEKTQALNRLHKSTEYQLYLLPALKELSKVRWLEIDKFKDRDTFVFKYQEMKAKAEAYEELIRLLAGMEEAEKKIATILNTPEANYAI